MSSVVQFCFWYIQWDRFKNEVAWKETRSFEGKTLRLYTSNHISSSWINLERKNHKSGSLQSQISALRKDSENISSWWLNFNEKEPQKWITSKLKLSFEETPLRLITSENISSSWLNFEGKNHKSGSLQSQSQALNERLSDSTILRTFLRL
jgi:hypothetical protein